jgi:hypothetical protein
VTVPLASISYYLTTVNTTTVYNLGCAHGHKDRDRAGTQRSIVILDFGATFLKSDGQYYSSLWSAADAPYSKVVAAVKAYGEAYWRCTENDLSSTAIIAMGTNNSAGAVTYAAGAAMARSVNSIGSYFATIKQVSAAGANDIEMGYSAPGPAKTWAQGYDSANNHPYYQFGSAEGCPTTRMPDGGDCGTSAYPEWTAYDVWYVAWGNPAAWPVPEIYLTDGRNAKQWKWLGVYSYQVRGSFMSFIGPMVQWQSCQQVSCSGTNNTASQGYTQLYNELNSDSRTAQTPPYVTDIKHN